MSLFSITQTLEYIFDELLYLIMYQDSILKIDYPKVLQSFNFKTFILTGVNLA